MSINDKLLKRINDLLILADEVLRTERKSNGTFSTSQVEREIFTKFKTASLSFIISIYGDKHPYYINFINECNSATLYDTKDGKGILSSIKIEIEEGWLNSLRGLVSAEIFVDFIEMAEHLISENYKDAAAVMTGSVLEEHLRQLCVKNGISSTETKNSKLVHKKADTLNAELTKAGIYNMLDQKNVTAWLDLRNKAAHGKYSEYTKEQVELMINAVMDFMSRNSI